MSRAANEPKYKWQFLTLFRAGALGWKASRRGMARLNEAVGEIRSVARGSPTTAAEGAVRLMERIWPAFQHIDTSSGALGGAVNWAIAEMVPVIARAPLSAAERGKLLERLWRAIREDGVSFLWLLEERWGEVCGSAEVASEWADRTVPLVRAAWAEGSFAEPTDLCLSSLLAAGRYTEVLDLLATAKIVIWPWRRYGILALRAQGKLDEALAYAEASRGINVPDGSVDAECESILLAAGRRGEAYERYAVRANEGNTGLATFRKIDAKYPEIDKERILQDLAELSGDSGKWFAAAKSAGFLDLAIRFAENGRTDPRTLSRAARDFAESDATFALRAGRMAVDRMLAGEGHEIDATDLAAALDHFLAAAAQAGMMSEARQDLRRLLTLYVHAPVYFRAMVERRASSV